MVCTLYLFIQGHRSNMIIPTDMLLLSMQVALLGGVTPRLRAVSIGYSETNVLHLNYYYEGVITDEDNEFASCAESDLMADYWDWNDPTKTQWSAIRLDPPQSVPWEGMLVYHRYEPNFKLSREPFPELILKEEKLDHVLIRLILLKTLLGNIVPGLRRICFDWEQIPMKLYFYYHGDISPFAREMAQKVHSSLILQLASYRKNPHPIQLHLERCDYPKKLPEIWGIYSRYDRWD